MPFRCPACSFPDTLEIARSIELPPDSRSDEITLQVVRCSGCGFGAVAVYEESRRGALEAEVWEHRGYYSVAADLDRLSDAIERCPDPGNPCCACPSHRALSQGNAQELWQGLADILRTSSPGILRTFPMERS